APPVVAPAMPTDAFAPTRVSIPSIELDEGLVDLGLTDTGEMEVPSDFDDVGWFTGGGRPGGYGPTVLAGHVDSTTGPAVFDRLPELAVGELVTVTDESGRVARYRIERTADYAKSEFPTAMVFGATRTDEIRLITCSGAFDAAVGSYERNVVVFGSRV
ncbi:MAG: class F sortase, partial [Rhodococcus sp. (in: high G+C Gram-positive bacteria)]